MKSKEELTQLAIDVVTNRVFMAQDGESVKHAFGIVLMLLDDEARQQMLEQKPAVLYEYIDKAGPREVNGYPSFFSTKWLTQEEWEVFFPIYEEKRKALYGPEETKLPDWLQDCIDHPKKEQQHEQ